MQNKKVEETKMKLDRELGELEIERQYNPFLDNIRGSRKKEKLYTQSEVEEIKKEERRKVLEEVDNIIGDYKDSIDGYESNVQVEILFSTLNAVKDLILD